MIISTVVIISALLLALASLRVLKEYERGVAFRLGRLREPLGPGIQMLLRSLERREAQELRARFLPLENNLPAIAAWIGRVQALPGYERTVPPHWKE